ncbi:mitochondrial inner-membrane-bound regulator-domain-containing protein [Hypoxylon trugodes]|uniref:mitochondrial inner-membrane-bound regulator-domain-containing protein n=1 Tax=Hypoxylon trugodes TaxID=326681 RepID=UPI00218F4F43|nr:mitochondrial inner-membrane-bound regulator-domain-containing protein [Hypoxylon trugodes]KAI1392230.1 mitochondrial inner-membrane-bound regulator-domain-containing protein [Hypoxylon trugodes]
MIAANVPGGAVCLRCQLRLLRQCAQPSQASNRFFRVHRPSQRPSVRYFTNESTSPYFHQDQTVEWQDGEPGNKKQARSKRAQGSEVYGVKRLGAPKKRLSRNRILTEDAGNLDSDMLGKPASVIIMRDGGMYKKKDHTLTSDVLSDEPNNPPTDIEALLNSQQEPPTAQEVRDNINGLRPKTETTLSAREFRKLQAFITNGFLNAQLEDYLLAHYEQGNTPHEPHKEDAAPVDGDKDQAIQYSWISNISPWIPLGNQPGIAEESDSTLYGYISDSATVKEKLAVRIMRECWGLSIAELDAGLGETRVRIQTREFQLLMRGTRRWVNLISKIWLDPSEKIEIIPKHHTLRFVTTKTKAATLMQDLNETLQQITTKTFSVNLITTEPIDEMVLEEVGRITNTHIRNSHNSQRLHVTWIELKKRAAQGFTVLEDLREVAFRLMLTAFNPQPSTTTALYIAALSAEEEALGRFITDAISKEKLGWKEKMGQWARYMLPLTLQATSSAMAMPPMRLTFPLEPYAGLPGPSENQEPPEDPCFAANPVKWARDLRVSTTANFGYLLHANDLSASPPPIHSLRAANHPRVFVPCAPHPLHLAQLERNKQEATHVLVQAKNVIVIRFWPSPTPKAHLGSDPREKTRETKKSKRKGRSFPISAALPPILELHLTVLGGEVKGVESLRAIKQSCVSDVMFPASAVDVRFTQTEYAILEGNPANLAIWQPLADFLEPARLDLERSKLETPPRQKFPIPRRLFSHSDTSTPAVESGSESVDPGVPSPSSNPDELISTQYTFVGLEVHRSITMPYEKFKLKYTFIDAQRGGAGRAEVSLEPEAGSSISPIKNDMDKLHDEFLVACHKFVTTDELWSGYSTTTANHKAY